ncbi:6279_t:CDS:2 [Acaulospora morrowiae]|uniref:6279_t:CDS:1 n=1 Tax=Acaulospora morrowiae TaxID=94023 RepID=A0A9N9C2E1_9GLOM|nr:6279_t:CDS:2 [Acaulospora morrowiae]
MISLRIPMFKREARENVHIWLCQTKNILHAQEVTNKGQMIHYATTGFEEAALHWFVNKVKDTTTTAFTD